MRKDFVRMMLTYCVVLIIPIIIIGIITITGLFAKLANDTRELNLKIIQESKKRLDNQAMIMLSSLHQLDNNDLIREFLSKEYTDAGVMAVDAWRIREELLKYQNVPSFFSQLCLYSENNGIIVDFYTNHTVGEFYDRYLSGGDYDYEKFSGAFKDGGNNFFISSYTEDGSDLTVMYFQRINRVNRQNFGYIIAIINQEAVWEVIESKKVSENMRFTAFDRNGYHVFNDGFKFEIADEEIIHKGRIFNYEGKTFVYEKSDTLNINYVYMIDNNEITGNVRMIGILFCCIVLLAIIIGVALTFIQTRRVNKYINSIQGENTSLSKNLNVQIENVRQQILHNILHGVYIESPEVLAEKYNIIFSGKTYCVADIRLGDEMLSFEVVSEKYESLWQDFGGRVSNMCTTFGFLWYKVQLSPAQALIIFNYNDSALFKSEFLKFVSEFSKKCIICIGVGDETTTISGISTSYEGSITCSQYVGKIKNEVVFYSDIVENENLKIYYTLDKEQLLVRSIKSGNAENVAKVLDEIYSANFDKRCLHLGSQRRLIINIISTLFKVIDEVYNGNFNKQIELSLICANLMRKDNSEECYSIIREICNSICDDAINLSENNTIKEQIEQYLDENYSNSQLSLDVLAEYMGISYNYFSTIFKENMGMNFTGYIMMLRLEKAKKLLMDTNYSIDIIAKMTGFSNTGNFFKVFKKCYGITPGKYRENSGK